MTTATKNARFAYNNFLDASSITATTAKAGYPVTNLLSSIRSKLYKPQNLFEIHSQNNKIYVDSSTFTIPSGTYTAAQLITAFNSIAGIGLVLSQGVNGFVITSAIAKTLKFSNQTNAAWEVLGFLTTADETITSRSADEYRTNSGVWIKVDLGMPQIVDFSALLAPAGEAFSCNTATIRLQGNNLDIWTGSLPIDMELDVSDEGAFFAGDVAQPCRYWRLFIDDKTNDDIKLAVGFIGASVICSNTNIATGFSRTRQDQSIKLISESGAFYVDRRPKVLNLSSISVQLLRADELKEMEQLFYDLGVEKPFFLCIDPKKLVSSSLAQMTHYVVATGDLDLQHVLRDYYNLSIELREVI